MLTLDKVYHAKYVLKNVIRETDVIYAPKINTESEIYLKTENLQITGSFKVRGAYYRMSCLSDEEKAKGVIACSAGNHALLFVGTREYPIRPTRRYGRRNRGGGARRERPRLHHGASAGLRYGNRRTRPHALGRPAPTHRHRPRAAERPAHPDSR